MHEQANRKPTNEPITMTDPPSNIRAFSSDQILELTWPDDRVDQLSYRYLRGECPCATCRDEWSGERILDPASIRSDLKLEGMESLIARVMPTPLPASM